MLARIFDLLYSTFRKMWFYVSSHKHSFYIIVCFSMAYKSYKGKTIENYNQVLNLFPFMI